MRTRLRRLHPDARPLMVLIGVAMVVSALARGGGALALGVVLGHDARAARRGAGLAASAPATATATRGERPGEDGPGAEDRRASQMSERARWALRRGSERARVRDRAHARRARAVRDHAQRGRLGDLLLARRGGGPRARAHAGRSSCSRACSSRVTMATYVEGSSLHIERGGASTFARYAFDEFWSFVAGWAILLDYLIVMAIGAVVISEYLTVFWSELDEGILPDRDRRRGAAVRGDVEHPRPVREPDRQRAAPVAVQHRRCWSACR